MNHLEIGFYWALSTYALIVVWTVLARLRWLPSVVARPVHRRLTGFEQIPILGRAVKAGRRNALSLGLVSAIVVGGAAPFVVLSIIWLGYGLSFGIAIVLGAWVFFNGSEERDLEPDPYGMHVEKSGHGLAYGDSPRADPDRSLP